MFQTLLTRFRAEPAGVAAPAVPSPAALPDLSAFEALSRVVFADAVAPRPIRAAGAGIDQMLSEPALVGFGMAAAGMARPEPIIRLGGVDNLRCGG